jgi:hypothetical protein
MASPYDPRSYRSRRRRLGVGTRFVTLRAMCDGYRGVLRRADRAANRRVALIKRIFKWAVAEELAPPAVHQAVAAVAGLQKGRTAAHETKPVMPVNDAVVDATLPNLGRHVRGLVEFQRLTGCRPGEACAVSRRV